MLGNVAGVDLCRLIRERTPFVQFGASLDDQFFNNFFGVLMAMVMGKSDNGLPRCGHRESSWEVIGSVMIRPIGCATS